jgi:hypothetical protein
VVFTDIFFSESYISGEADINTRFPKELIYIPRSLTSHEQTKCPNYNTSAAKPRAFNFAVPAALPARRARLPCFGADDGCYRFRRNR